MTVSRRQFFGLLGTCGFFGFLGGRATAPPKAVITMQASPLCDPGPAQLDVNQYTDEMRRFYGGMAGGGKTWRMEQEARRVRFTFPNRAVWPTVPYGRFR